MPQSAQRLKEERDDALRRLEQASLEQTMGAALAETQVRREGARQLSGGLVTRRERGRETSSPRLP